MGEKRDMERDTTVIIKKRKEKKKTLNIMKKGRQK